MITYQMRAYHTVLTQMVFWDSPGAPDMTGTLSGHTPGDLSGIVVMGKVAGNAQIIVDLAQDKEVDGIQGTLAIPSSKDFDGSLYPSYTVTFVAVLYTNNVSNAVTAFLYNSTDKETVTGTSVNTTSTTPTILESSALTIGDAAGNLQDSQKLYEIRLSTAGSTAADYGYLQQAYLRIQ